MSCEVEEESPDHLKALRNSPERWEFPSGGADNVLLPFLRLMKPSGCSQHSSPAELLGSVRAGDS